MAALVGNEYSAGTLERYETSMRHTRSFLQWKYKVDDMDITQLNYEFISEYEFWLKSVRKCSHNPAMKYLSNFRKIVNRCIRNGWLQKDPFLGFKMTKREIERTALTELELEAISALSFPTERLRLQRLHQRTDYEGTGIGLAICRKIVTIHGGIIIAEGSDTGRAVFTIILPMRQ
ncbi:MAG: phage integrase SAM-like domain-containing protein [Niastella sp.]|nr:phage integrase SAM-like domain-containing protein [Niastella sp.]